MLSITLIWKVSILEETCLVYEESYIRVIHASVFILNYLYKSLS